MNSTPSTPTHRLPIWLQERFASAYKEILSDEAREAMKQQAIHYLQNTIEDGADNAACVIFPNLDITDKTIVKCIADADCSTAWGAVVTAQPLNGDNAQEWGTMVVNAIITKARVCSLFGVDVEDYVRGIFWMGAIDTDCDTNVRDAVDELEHWLAITDGQSIFGRYLKANPEADETLEEIRLGFALEEADFNRKMSLAE